MRDGSDAARDPSALRARALRYSAQGNYSYAERYLLKTLRNLNSPGSRPTPAHLFLWNDLGMVYKDAGRFNQAETCYRKALRHSQRCLKGLSRDFFRADLFHNLGGLEHSRRRFRSGERFARESLRLRRLVAGPRSLPVASDMAALAALLDGQGKFAEAEKLYRQALRVYRREYGANHPEIAVVLNNLAAVYQATGRPRRALAGYTTALRMKRRKLGRTHPDVGATLNNLGMLHKSRGDERAATRCFEEALRILQQSLGASHPNTRIVRTNYQRLRKESA